MIMIMMEMMTMMTHHWVELAASKWRQQKSLLSGLSRHSMGHLALKSHRDGDDYDDDGDDDVDEVDDQAQGDDDDDNDDEDLAL